MIKEALQALQNKQIILYPTDTVWGIGGDATSAEVPAQERPEDSSRPACET